MRRWLSCLLVLVFGLPVVAPALGYSSDPESLLPACCRRNGAHHCMLSPEEIQALLSGQQVSVLASHCPCFPASLVPLTHQQLAFHQPAPLTVSAIWHSLPVQQAQASARISQAVTRHKRGPPSQLL